MPEKSAPSLPDGLTHVNASGEAHMVDVASKAITQRRAVARSRVKMSAKAFSLLETGATSKGDVLAAARIAGIQGSKRTSELIPLCHIVALTRVSIDISLEQNVASIVATAEAVDRTGVEMEALVAASTAALTIYDMLKAVDRSITFDVALVEKSGGKSGPWQREDDE